MTTGPGDARLHKGLKNPLPGLPKDIGAWLADALSGGDLGEEVVARQRPSRGRSNAVGEEAEQ